MSKMEIFTRSFNFVKDIVKEKSPEILVTAGVGLVIFAGVKACQKTLELPEIVETHKELLKEIDDNKSDDGETIETTAGTMKVKDAVLQTQAHFVRDIVKLYALPVGLGMMGIACIVGSHYILEKRATKAMGAYIAVSEAFNNYRGRVRDRFGDEIEKEIRYNIRKEETEETVTNEKGKQKTVKKKVDVVDPDVMLDDYTAFFTSFTAPDNWNANMSANRDKIVWVERIANQRLRSRGKLYINELLEDLGIDGRPSGQFVGWIFDDKDPKHVGDNYVRIEVEETTFKNPKTGQFEPGFILSFNADGNIVEKAYNR